MPVIDTVFNQSVNAPWAVHSADSISRFLLPPGVKAEGHFLSDTAHWGRPELLVNATSDGFPGWIFYVFFGMLAVFALFRFYYPTTFRMIIGYLKNPVVLAEKDNTNRPGFMIVFFQFAAYLIDVGFLLYLLNQKWNWVRMHDHTFLLSLLFWISIVLIYFFFNQIFARLSGLLFQTVSSADIQVKMVSYMAYSQAIFLTPVLFFYLYTRWDYMLYLAVLIVVVFLFVKWIQISRIGMTKTGYTAFHLFLYLCALEIIPVLLLIKVAVLQV
ncbi:MAG: DUF4271 domain-containing protein [Bacteroidales bacterium]|nr:DUF4271 domain-containing protein [Bacteroidales bacterium]